MNSIGEDAFDYNPLESVNISKDATFGLSGFPDDTLVDRRDVNDIPVDIAISKTSFDENIIAGSAVANLQSIDPDKGDTFTYAFASGGGDTDNSALTLDGDQLKIIDSPDFESKDSYLIRIQAKDSGGLTFEKSLTLTVNDMNENPSDLMLSTSIFEENIGAGSTVAILTSADQDTDDSHTYTLISGDGDTDNDAFTIDGDQLKIINSPDFETKDSYSIRLKTTDSGGLTFERSLTFSVNDLQEINYDFNGDQSLSIEQDAVIGLRSMFGTFPGDALIHNAWNEQSSKNLAQIQQELTGYFQDFALDLDSDGMISPLTDGIQMVEELQAIIQDGSSQSLITDETRPGSVAL